MYFACKSFPWKCDQIDIYNGPNQFIKYCLSPVVRRHTQKLAKWHVHKVTTRSWCMSIFARVLINLFLVIFQLKLWLSFGELFLSCCWCSYTNHETVIFTRYSYVESLTSLFVTFVYLKSGCCLEFFIVTTTGKILAGLGILCRFIRLHTDSNSNSHNSRRRGCEFKMNMFGAQQDVMR